MPQVTEHTRAEKSRLSALITLTSMQEIYFRCELFPFEWHTPQQAILIEVLFHFFVCVFSFVLYL